MAENVGDERPDAVARVPRLVVTPNAASGLSRCLDFLARYSLAAAMRAAGVIEKHLAQLEMNPAIGRPVPDYVERRELIVRFGNSGYVALYEFDAAADEVLILAFRHQREAGY